MTSTNAAESLSGLTLPGGWEVGEKLQRGPDDTGGRFSVNYIVERNGDRAFCKVINYAWIMESRGGSDPARLLEQALSTYNFERDIARECARMSKIVTAIDDGHMTLPDCNPPLVNYIIFEMADKDIRRMLNDTEFVATPFKLRLLHSLATALRQLHSRQISHQDVKPSNLLVFGSEHDRGVGKLADLGRAIRADTPGPYDGLPFAGDFGYAPPEALYHDAPRGFAQSRLAADIYQLGSMVSYCFTAMPINAHLNQELFPTYHWSVWQGSFSEVLPYVTDAMGRVIASIEEASPESIRKEIGQLMRQLCEPNPLRRGDKTRISHPDQYSLVRFVSRLNLLEQKAAIAEARA